MSGKCLTPSVSDPRSIKKFYDMKFVFWQNVLSIHQNSFLAALAREHDVTLVVEKEMDEVRRASGWRVPDFGDCRIVIAPDNLRMESLFEDRESVHVFWGIEVFPLVTAGMHMAIKYGVKFGVFSEPINIFGAKGKLRIFKYFLLKMKYYRYFSFMLLAGDLGINTYQAMGYPKKRMFEWGYFTGDCKTERVSYKYSGSSEGSKPSLIFIGSLDERKNILKLIDSVKRVKDRVERFLIIGNGHLREEVERRIASEDYIKYLGVVNNEEVSRYLSESDLLILPSLFDGWGAVTSESLMCGTPVLCSDRCGSSTLVGGERGAVFSIGKGDLDEKLESLLSVLPYEEKRYEQIRKWAGMSISGEAATQYFTEIVNCVINGGIRPIAPWKR